MSAEIAVIDMAPWFSGTAEGQALVVDDVRRSRETTGFFIIGNHGVDEDLVERMYLTSRAFFDLPVAAKTRVGESGEVGGGLMYFPMFAEQLAATLGQDTPADVKESLDYGPGFLGDRWPGEPLGLQTVWQVYFDALSGLAAELRQIFARAMGLDDGFFDASFDDHLSSLRVINYPEHETAPEPGQLRAGEHTDYGFLTILRSEDRPGGLQVHTRDGQWLAPPALPGTFIANIGDALMRWTNDRWVSTPHRVANPPAGQAAASRRQSIAYFHNPAKGAVIDCLAPFQLPGVVRTYEPITYGDYAALRYRQAHGRDSDVFA